MVSVREENGKKNDAPPKKWVGRPKTKKNLGVKSRKGHGKERRGKKVGECGDLRV